MWGELALQWSPAVVPIITAAAAVIAAQRARKKRRERGRDEQDENQGTPADHDHDIALILVEGLRADLAKRDDKIERLLADLRDERHEKANLKQKVYSLEIQLGRHPEPIRMIDGPAGDG